jgi:hypothetical protein
MYPGDGVSFRAVLVWHLLVNLDPCLCLVGGPLLWCCVVCEQLLVCTLTLYGGVVTLLI